MMPTTHFPSLRYGGIMVVVVAAVIILGIFLALAASMATATRYRIPDTGSTLRVIFTGESLGRIMPNMCDGYLAGGLEFRAAYMAQQQRPFLLLDSGCVVSSGADAALWGEEILRAMKDMGYDAVNLGEHEVALGATAIKHLATVGPPLVSANVLDADSDEPLLAPFVVSRRGGYRAAITGLVDEAIAHGPGLRVAAMGETLARLLPTLREQAEVIIVLADIDHQQATELATLYPEIHLILHRSRNNTRIPEVINRSLVGAIYGDRYVADTTITWQGQRRLSAETTAHEMSAGASDSAVLADVPEGLRVEPAVVDFGTIADGEQRVAQLTIHNDSTGTVQLTRILSTCGCFVLAIDEREIPPGAALEVSVTLHAVALEASSSVALYLQVAGAVNGMLRIPAQANIIAAPGVAP